MLFPPKTPEKAPDPFDSPLSPFHDGTGENLNSGVALANHTNPSYIPLFPAENNFATAASPGDQSEPYPLAPW